VGGKEEGKVWLRWGAEGGGVGGRGGGGGGGKGGGVMRKPGSFTAPGKSRGRERAVKGEPKTLQ